MRAVLGQFLYRGGVVLAGAMLGMCWSNHWPWWAGFWAGYLACEVIDYYLWKIE